MPRHIRSAALVGTLAFAAISAAVGQELGAIDFRRDIAPIFQQRCLACHAEKQSGGLRLTSRESWQQAGDSGPPFDAANPDRSLLLRRIAAPADSDDKMPPEGPRLKPDEIDRLRRWIAGGADWPAEVVLQSPRAAALEHWSFRPIRRPTVPIPADPARARNAIDAFVAARLDAERIDPSPEADKATLLRRVTLDLIGLPPTPEELEAFVRDDRPDAYEAAVTRLLQSPHYGERWARPWLDLCHFADTDGYLTDQERPVAWRYRDWLIDALNRDLPFDRFTVEQLAGDLLPSPTQDQLLATGLLRNTLSNREGGADLEEFRVEQVVDRTRIVGAGWLGLTVGCARCHDHKFDPLSQAEFFGLYAFFDAADEVNIDAPLAGEREKFEAAYAGYRRRRDELIAPVKSALEALQSRWEARMLEAVAHPSADPLWDRQWEVLGLIWGGRLGEGQLEGCFIAQTTIADRTQDEQDRLLDYFLTRGSLIDEAQFAELKLTELASALEELKKTVPWPTRAPAMRQARFERPARIHTRGDFRVPGSPVAAAIPEWLAGIQSRATETTSGATAASAVLEVSSTPHGSQSRGAQSRLDLARWLVSPENPLTARVVVNRMWQEFFGRGLVDPPDDFGLRGQPPSHAELLDWLASEFVRRQWSVKEMHRLIATSATYRQSSHARSELAAVDPRNRLLARQVPLRLSADQVRDAALAASGLLDARLGGPSVFPPQPEIVAQEGFSNTWTVSAGGDRYRRGLYTWTQRLSPYAQNVTFDAPPTSLICVRRDRSNSPLQALTLLNDPAFFEAAQALGRRLAADAASSDAERIEALIRRALSRPATATERQLLQGYLDEQRALLRQEASAASAIAPQSVDGVDAAELAAWTNLGSVVLNLHEFVTRD